MSDDYDDEDDDHVVETMADEWICEIITTEIIGSCSGKNYREALYNARHLAKNLGFKLGRNCRFRAYRNGCLKHTINDLKILEPELVSDSSPSLREVRADFHALARTLRQELRDARRIKRSEKEKFWYQYKKDEGQSIQTMVE